jgi:ABC-2 type transport system ATP-binding protein
MSNILEVQEIVKNYANHRALDQVSITVPKGSIYGLLGPNGAGKTSLIRIINQITAPDSGRVLFDGEALSPKHIEHIGYLPEERGLYKKMSVGEQAVYLAQLKGMREKDAKERLKYWFEKFEMKGWWDKKIEELSKGMQQKVQFITTVIHEPKMLIFDEPFSGFDPINANLIKNEILELRDRGATIIFSTHRMESVEELCDHIALINRSKKVLEGKLSDIKQRFKQHIFGVEFSQNVEWTETPGVQLIEHSGHHLRLKTSENISSNPLLRSLMALGEIVHFSEEIPSANDIFMQTVEGSDHE